MAFATEAAVHALLATKDPLAKRRSRLLAVAAAIVQAQIMVMPAGRTNLDSRGRLDGIVPTARAFAAPTRLSMSPCAAKTQANATMLADVRRATHGQLRRPWPYAITGLLQVSLRSFTG